MIIREVYGPVEALRQSRPFLGRSALLSVRCYAVDGLMIDCGMPPRRADVLRFAQEKHVHTVALTHHHEDHSGNAAALLASSYEVRASPEAARRIADGFSQYFYQIMAWGRMRPARVGTLPPVIETEHHRFEVVGAPGHCPDLVVFHEAGEGWLFSGDAFLGERIKLFRADEDFDLTVSTLERLCALDFDAVYCAHRPVVTGGHGAMERKLDYLRSLGEEVRALWAQGLSVEAITTRTLGRESRSTTLWTSGDVGKGNLVRSILFGPRARPR